MPNDCAVTNSRDCTGLAYELNFYIVRLP